MSSSVDTRVVEMQFDNASFQRGVAETMSTLEQLSDKLDKGDVGISGIEALQKAINGISFDSIGSGLDGFLSKAGSAFGEITNMVGSFGKAIAGVSGIAAILGGGGAIYQAISGGSQRATNIENARFMIEGLRGDWQALSEDINYAVDGTAYGFDAAANAAAQLTASGVQAGEAMKTALRGVSGVAAQTNSDYESISHIFTTVAGQGKLMTMQLRQLELRGLNAAAILGEQLGYSEAEIREMVTAGVIDFETFAQAMDDAFGEHAKEANKTFTGAVANMKAALNKIGADFFMPIHEMERQTALGFRLFFNAIREGLNTTPLEAGMKQFGLKLNSNLIPMKSTIQSFTENMTEFGANVYSAFEKLTASGVIQRFVSNFAPINDALFHGFNVNASAIITTLFDRLSEIDLSPFTMTMIQIGDAIKGFADITAAQIPQVINILANLASSFFNVVGAIGSVALPVFDAFFGFLGDLLGFGADGVTGFLEFLADWTKGLADFTAQLGLSSDQMAAVKGVFSGFFGFVGSVLTPIGGLLATVGDALGNFALGLWPALESLGNVIGSVLGPALEVLGGALSTAITYLAEFLSGIVKFIQESVDLSVVADFFSNMAESVSSFMSGVNVDGLTDFFDSLKDGSGIVQDAGAAFAKAGEAILGFFLMIGSVIAGGIDGLGTFIQDATKGFLGLTEVQKAYADDGLGGIVNKIETADSAITNAGGSIIQTLSGIVDNVKSFVEGFRFEDILTAISAGVTGLMVGIGLKTAHNASKMFEAITKTVVDFSKIPESIANVFGAISSSIEGFAKALNKQANAELIKSVGISLALLAGSLFLLSQIEPSRLINAGIALGLVAAGLAIFIAAISLINKYMTKGLDAKGLASLALELNAFAVAIGIMAGSIALLAGVAALLSLIDPGRLMNGVFAVLTLMAGMMAMSMALSNIKTAYSSMLSFAAVILSLGMAIMPLVAAVTLLSFLPWQQVAVGIAELAAILIVMATVTSRLGAALMRGDAANIAAFAAAILAIGLAIIPLVASVVVLSSIPFEKAIAGIAALAAIMITLGVAVGVMSVLMNPATAAAILTAAAAIVAFGLAMLSFTGAVAVISSLPLDGVEQAVAALQEMVIAFTFMGVILGLLSNPAELIAISVALIAFGAAVAILAGSLLLLSMAPNITQGVIALLVVLASFLAIGALLSTVLQGAAGVLVVFGAAILLVGAGMAAAGLGLMAFATGIAMLAALGPAAAMSIGTAMEIMAEKTGSSVKKLATGIAEGIVAFQSALAENSGTIAASTGELGKAAAEGLTAAAPEFGNAGVQAFLAFIQGIGENAGAAASAGLLIIEHLIIGLASGIGDVIDAGSQLVIMSINGIADAIRENASMLGDAVTNVVATIFSLVEGLIADGLEAIFGPNPVADWIRENAAEEAAEAEAASQRVNEAFASKNEEMLAKQQEAMDKMASITSAGGDQMAEAGEGSAQSMLDGISGILDMLPEEQRGTIQESLDAISGLTGEAQGTGEEIGTAESEGVISAIDEKSGEIKSSAQNAIDGAKTVDADGSSVGSNFGSGVAAGIDSWIGSVCERAREMVRQAKAAANAEQNAKSPSRDMMKSGGWFAQGFAIGIVNDTNMVVAAATSMVSQAKEPVEGLMVAMSSLMDGIDWDSQPVITPVLDTSQIEGQMPLLEGLFPETALIGAAMLQGDMLSNRALEGANSVKYGDNYNFNLQYDAGADATDIVMGMARSMRTRSLLEA